MVNNAITKALIARGDQKKFRQLMDLTSDELLLFAVSFLRNREVAEEVVSDVFVKIWKNRSELENIKNLKSYLFISVKNGCLSHLRKAAREKIVSIDEYAEFHFLPVEGPEDSLIEDETLEMIYETIEKLPAKCKLAFTLAKINGLKYKEIAEIMEISEKTVNNHLVNAVKRITDILSDKTIADNRPSSFKRASLFSFLW